MTNKKDIIKSTFSDRVNIVNDYYKWCKEHPEVDINNPLSLIGFLDIIGRLKDAENI